MRPSNFAFAYWRNQWRKCLMEFKSKSNNRYGNNFIDACLSNSKYPVTVLKVIIKITTFANTLACATFRVCSACIMYIYKIRQKNYACCSDEASLLLDSLQLCWFYIFGALAVRRQFDNRVTDLIFNIDNNFFSSEYWSIDHRVFLEPAASNNLMNIQIWIKI